MTDDRVIVIGSGLGGLAAANTLAARGHNVTLLEANAWLGGKAAVCEGDGFRFDMGPTILTVPRVIERIFQEAGRDMHDYLDLRRLDPQWRCFFEDGSVLDLEESVAAMTQRLSEYADADNATGYEQFVALSKQLHEISDKFFFWKSVEDMRDTFDASTTFKASTLKDVLNLRMGRSVAGTIRGHVKDHRVAQMLDHFTQYVGSSPYGSPAVLCGIAHMQLADGVWYPIGGTRAVPEALARLAGELGVEARTGCEVKRIIVENGAARGVETADGEIIRASAVVSNMDSVRTMRELVGGAAAERFLKRRRYEPACSGVVLYLGLEEAYPQVLHHNFVFSQDPEVEFDQIYKRGVPAADPTCYVAAPAQTEAAVAPPGGEALYVLVHTPYLRPGQDWKQMLPDYRDVIIDKLKRCAGMTDIEQRIAFESALTPQGIHNRYRVLDGAIYGLASHGLFKGAFKPGNRSRDIADLYMAGGAAHPGPGMPMVMMSGWIAGDTLDQDRRGGSANPAFVSPATKSPSDEAPPFSGRAARIFARYLRTYFRRNFNAVRMSRAVRAPAQAPLILYTNHPAWWDPIMLLLIGDEYFQGREGYGPIDAKAVERYGFLKRLGLFGVDHDSRRSIQQFLRQSDAILKRDNAVLCITAEGHFADPRTRPVKLQTGVAHLMRRHPDVPVVPLALEYPFWNERAPEALARFGHALPADPERASRSVEELNAQLEQALETTMDALAEEAMSRDPALFDTMVEGRKGVGGVYDGTKRLKAWFTGRSFDPAHAAARRPVD